MAVWRIASGLVTVLSAAWVASSSWSDGWPYEALVALLGASITWLVAETHVGDAAKSQAAESGQSNELSPHDVSLGNKMRLAFPKETRQLLRTHDFGAVYQGWLIDPLDQVAHYWTGVEHEFIDDELSRLGGEVVAAAKKFMLTLATYAGVADNWPEGHFSLPPNPERRNEDFSDRTFERIKEVNGLADDLMRKYEMFERTFRLRSPNSFGTEPIP